METKEVMEKKVLLTEIICLLEEKTVKRSALCVSSAAAHGIAKRRLWGEPLAAFRSYAHKIRINFAEIY